MFIPEKMIQVHVVFLEKDVTEVAETVVRHGALQVVDSADMEDWAKSLSPGAMEEDIPELKKRQELIASLIKSMNLSEHFEDIEPVEEMWSASEPKIMEIQKEVNYTLEQLAKKEDEAKQIRELKSHLEGLAHLDFSLKQRDTYAYLAVEIGLISVQYLEPLQSHLKSLLHVLSVLNESGGNATILVVALKRDQDKLQVVLADSGFQRLPEHEEEAVFDKGKFEELDQKEERILEELEKMREKFSVLASRHDRYLRSVLFHVRRETLKKQIVKYFRKTRTTFLLSGWLPEERKDPFITEINRATRNRCIIKTVRAEEVEAVKTGQVQVPVKLNNPFLFRPFEFLTKTYGTPDYRSIDPTPILGISILIMFGVMFGDVGHGLVLGLLGVFMAWKGKKQSLRNAGLLLGYAGFFSIIFGFLFGSIFGVEDLLPTIWLKPMESISTLFSAAIFFGIGMITLAIFINMINGFRKGDFLGMIFDKAGLLAVVIYWGGIMVASRALATSNQAKADLPFIIPLVMIVSVVLLFFREPIIHLLQGKRQLFPEGVTSGIMGGIVELLEIFLGFLANTVSFIRVAAFGLAHAGLFMAIFSLSDSVRHMAGGLISVLVLIFGNILIICLEGLVVSIQAVRLEFYEFFSRFFQRGDIDYKPLEAELMQKG